MNHSITALVTPVSNFERPLQEIVSVNAKLEKVFKKLTDVQQEAVVLLGPVKSLGNTKDDIEDRLTINNRLFKGLSRKQKIKPANKKKNGH